MAKTLDADRFLKLLSDDPPTLDPLYLVSGDEPLLITEIADAVRATASRLGFTERTSLVLDARSDWSAAIAATQNVSLFGDRRLVELQLPSGKPGKTGADTLGKLAAMASEGALSDTLLLISLPRLDKTTRNSKWAQAVFQAGTSIEISSINRNQLPGWIGTRLARQGQTLARESLEWMADKVEGNLLAAHQEIMKLGLLYPEGAISQEDLEKAVLNVARYDVFGLRDAMLAGQGDKALTMLAGLRAEGEALPLVLWAVGDEIRVMARLAEAQTKNADLSAEMRKNRIFGNREQLVRQVLRRVPARAWPAAVQHAHDVDRLIKGLKVDGRLNDPWEELARLTLRIAVAGKKPA